MPHIITEEERLIEKNKRFKLWGWISLAIIIIALAVILWPKSQKIEVIDVWWKNVFDNVLNDVEWSGEITNDSGSVSKTATWLDSKWGVAPNKIDKLMADPEMQKDPVKFKKAIDQLNKETNWIIDNNKITINELAWHSSKEDCWSAIDWYIYNITEFFGKHPGWDDALLKICWKDWTELFLKQHWSNQSAKNTLDTLKIWILSK